MLVGLTGSSGSGKSEISKIFAENGFTVINLDELSKKVQSKGSECLEEIVSYFGENILFHDGSLDRKALGEIVFTDSAKLKILNSITHKYILKAMDDIIDTTKGDILLDAPLLFESGLDKRCDKNIGVISVGQKQIERLCTRDGITSHIAEERLKRQHTNDFFKQHCDYTIENNTTKDDARADALEIINILKGKDSLK